MSVERLKEKKMEKQESKPPAIMLSADSDVMSFQFVPIEQARLSPDKHLLDRNIKKESVFIKKIKIGCGAIIYGLVTLPIPGPTGSIPSITLGILFIILPTKWIGNIISIIKKTPFLGNKIGPYFDDFLGIT